MAAAIGYVRAMPDLTAVLQAIDAGDPQAAEQLLPLVYEQLRRLAAWKLSQEKPGQTLDATSLVHEAYLRLVGTKPEQPWASRGHFFAAAAEAMRRILVENARRKQSQKRGGGMARHDIADVAVATPQPHPDVLALDEALSRLAAQDKVKADLVQLRYFAGLTLDQAAGVLGISPATADRYWAYAKAWLYHELTRGDTSPGPGPKAAAKKSEKW
jgi:RNA polymerase sigma factor (TIGR02999 family)